MTSSDARKANPTPNSGTIFLGMQVTLLSASENFNFRNSLEAEFFIKFIFFRKLGNSHEAEFFLKIYIHSKQISL